MTSDPGLSRAPTLDVAPVEETPTKEAPAPRPRPGGALGILFLLIVAFFAAGCAPHSFLPFPDRPTTMSMAPREVAPAPPPLPVSRAMRDEARVAAARKLCDDQAFSVCKAACDGGNIDACVQVATAYLLGQRVPRDAHRADALLDAACREGAPLACLTQGGALERRDKSRAVDIYTRACRDEGGTYSELSCAALMHMMDGYRFVPTDAERLYLYRRACALASAGSFSFSGACGRLKDLAEAAPHP